MSTFIQQEINKRTKWVYFTNYRWVAHVAYWAWVFVAGTVLRVKVPITFEVVLNHFFLANLNIAIFYYLYCFFLVPYLFKRNKNLLFWSLLVISFFVLTVADVEFNSHYVHFEGETSLDPKISFWENYLKIVFGYIFNFLLFTMILFFMEKSEENSLILEMEEEKKEIEMVKLDLLKTNISPDFMMRSLRQLKRAATLQEEDTPASIIAFSELLRYRLYRGKQLQTPLKEEIEALKTFINFISFDQQNNLQVEMDIIGEVGEKFIAALALINLLEPFCKISPDEPTLLKFHLRIAPGSLHVKMDYNRSAEGQLLQDLDKYGEDYKLLYGDSVHFKFENCEEKRCEIEMDLHLL